MTELEPQSFDSLANFLRLQKVDSCTSYVSYSKMHGMIAWDIWAADPRSLQGPDELSWVGQVREP